MTGLLCGISLTEKKEIKLTKVESLTQEIERLRRFLDYEVRSWLVDEDEHHHCDYSCGHKALWVDKFNALEDILEEGD